jgi:hypothetical protein
VSLAPRLALAALGLLLAAPDAALATHTPLRSRNLWATINVCDTPKHADTIGVRGSMPGTGRHGERMYMRIQLEYLDRATQQWTLVGSAGDSHTFYVGAATHKVRQGGMSFAFQPPASGSALLRGRVTFDWRRGRKTVYRGERLTEEGHTNAAQADPPGYSAATCEIKGPGGAAARVSR